MSENAPLELSQLVAGLEAELVGQHLPRLPVHLERIRLPPGSVQSEHELTA